jgi:hypothetical protein
MAIGEGLEVGIEIDLLIEQPRFLLRTYSLAGRNPLQYTFHYYIMCITENGRQDTWEGRM